MNTETNVLPRVEETSKTLSENPKERASQLDEIFRQAARDGSLYE